jgi:predicted GIY-YIG superfamily endonuclease
MIGYIYVIENLINGKMYVGQSVDPDRRRTQQYAGETFSAREVSING